MPESRVLPNEGRAERVYFNPSVGALGRLDDVLNACPCELCAGLNQLVAHVFSFGFKGPVRIEPDVAANHRVLPIQLHKCQ